ncbi:MAG TPA: DUF1573 domain-containing protein [Planctomycetaceae bacterium]|nr:DUF1573 domain-containing protein [Planctomycetaceae bacterium]
MKVGTILVALVFTSAAVACAVWLSQPADQIHSMQTYRNDSSEGDWPAISKTGPWPKAVVEVSEHNFGKTLAGKEGSHTFVIRNEGQADLVLAKGETQCRCTLSELAQKAIPPGQAGEVTLTWLPDHPNATFSQSAEIRSNDPENQSIRLIVSGVVEELITIEPSDVWTAGHVSAVEPAVVTGSIRSAFLDDFKVLELITSGDHTTAEAILIPHDSREAAGMKSGYLIRVTLHPGGPMGSFNEELTLRTDIRGGTDLKIHVTGQRQGPLRMVQLRGVRWNEEVQRATLDKFPASQGKTGVLLLFIEAPEGQEAHIEVVEDPASNIRATIEKDAAPQSGNRARFRLTLEVPPGLPPITAIRETAPRVTLKTNHPAVPEYTFQVGYITENR